MTSPTPRSAMVTAGIDLSADPKKTGVATLAWLEDGAIVTAVEVGQHTDADLAELIQRVDKAGIDCPLGWPIAFVDYLIAHRADGQDLNRAPDQAPPDQPRHRPAPAPGRTVAAAQRVG